jgi:VWFA-related protein
VLSCARVCPVPEILMGLSVFGCARDSALRNRGTQSLAALFLLAGTWATARQAEAPAVADSPAAPASVAVQKPAPEAPPPIPVTAGPVVVDVVVTDAQGNSITGLRVDEFLLKEDGVGQTLSSFEAIDLAATAAAVPVAARRPSPQATRLSKNPGQDIAAPFRIFVLVFDDLHLSPARAADAKKAARELVAKSTQPGDIVTLVVPGTRFAWTAQLPDGWDQLDKVLDSLLAQQTQRSLITDREALRIIRDADAATEEIARQRLLSAGRLPKEADPHAGVEPGGETTPEQIEQKQRDAVRSEAQSVLDAARAGRRRVLEFLATMLDGLSAVKGRKAVVLLSEGFVHEPEEQQFRDVVSAARRGNAAVYYLDLEGLTAVAKGADAGRQDETEGAEILAGETGGFTVRSRDDLPNGLERIARESSSHYLLGYSPTNAESDAKFHKIEVEVKRPGAIVRARTGYFAPTGEQARHANEDDGADARLERALATPAALSGIPTRLTAYAFEPVENGKTRIGLAGEIDAKNLHFDQGPEGALTTTLEVMTAITHVTPGMSLSTPWQEWKVRIPAEAQGKDFWLPIERSFDLAPGMCQARLLVRERNGVALGSAVYSFAVPEYGKWRVSSRVLSTVLPEEANRRPPLLVSREFAVGSVPYCYFEMYHAAKDPALGLPRVAAGYSLLDRHGKVRQHEALSPVVPGTGGRLVRVIDLPLTGFVPGEYELVLNVRDEVAGTMDELHERLSVRPPSRPSVGLYTDLARTYLEGNPLRAMSGLLQWPLDQLAAVAAQFPKEDEQLLRAALLLHTDTALFLWRYGHDADASAHVAIGHALLKRAARSDLLRDWLLTLGSFAQANTLLDQALAYFNECAAAYSDAAEAWLGAGSVQETLAYAEGLSDAQTAADRSKAAQEAERCYREALRIDPALVEARLRLGRVLKLAGRTQEAERELSAVIETSHDSYVTGLARLFWGEIREERGDRAGAIRLYHAALAADRNCQPAALALSDVLRRTGRRRDAVETLMPALRSTDDTRLNPWLEYRLGLGQRFPAELAKLRQTLPAPARPER